ncbi:3937_t:CDS:1, partial [Racocetra persica]
ELPTISSPTTKNTRSSRRRRPASPSEVCPSVDTLTELSLQPE